MAVVVDAVGVHDAGNSNSFSCAITIAGANRHALVFIASSASTVSNVLVGSTTCSLIGTAVTLNSEKVEVWETDSEPATGAQNATGDFAGMNHISVNVISFNGVDAVTPTNGHTTNSGTGTSATVSVTTGADDYAAAMTRAAAALVENGDGVEESSGGTGGKDALLASADETDGTAAFSCSLSSADWVAVGVNVLAPVVALGIPIAMYHHKYHNLP